MAEKQFVWLASSCDARNGRRLETGKTYKADAFEATVVEEWVRSGAAQWADHKKKSAGQEE